MTDKSTWQRVRFGDVVQLNKERCTDPLAAGIERYVGLEYIGAGRPAYPPLGNRGGGHDLHQPLSHLFGSVRQAPDQQWQSIDSVFGGKMIASAFLLPTELPPRSIDIKRALLTYDTVVMPSADDRELIPPNAYALAQGIPPLFGMSVGAVRPLGKIPQYDTEYEKVLATFNKAIQQNALIVKDAPVYHQTMTIGGVPLPDGIPDPRAVYQIYRQMATDQNFIGAIGRSLDYLVEVDENSVELLAPSGADDGGFQIYVNGVPQQGLPAQATYNGFVIHEEYRGILTRLCLARLGSLVKSLLICDMNTLQPYTSDDGMASVIQMLSNNTKLVFDKYGEKNHEIATLNRLNRLHDIVIAEFVDPAYLDSLPVQKVLKMRSQAWGKAQEARSKLERQLRLIALENPEPDAFDNACRKALKEYHKAQADWRHEARKLVKDTIVSFTKIGVTSLASAYVSSAPFFQKLLLPGPIAQVLSAGVAAAWLLAQDPILDAWMDHWKKQGDQEANYAIFRPYQRFIR